MIIVPYKAEHLKRLLEQPGHENMLEFMSSTEYQRYLEAQGESFTALEGDKILACAGLLKMWKGRAVAWAIMDKDLKKHFLSIHYAVKRFLSATDYRRIETHVYCDFEQGKRWIELLGFTCEGVLHKYTPDGFDCFGYSRIK